jgi:hypothetical protein
MQKTEIKRRLEKLNKIKDQITRLENNKDKKYTIERDNENDVKEVKMDNINGFDMKVTVKQLSDKIEELGKEAPDFIIARNTIIAEEGDTTPYYELILSDKSDVRKLTRILNRINKEYVQIDKLSLTAAKRQALQQDLLKLQEYLQGYINDPNKPLEPFIPESGDAFEKLCAIDPELASLGKLNKKANKPTEGNPNSTYNDGTTETAPGNTENNNINTTNNPNTNVVNDRDFSDKNYIETFKE